MEKWVIVNPAGGRGKVGRLSGAILKAARQEGAKAFLTEGPGHATELAQRAPEGARVVAVGGDGTVHEVLKGLAGTGKVLGVVPIGSGNDFARMLGLLGLPWPKALELALHAPEEAVDLGWVNGEPFGASLGIGFDALVAKKALSAPPSSGECPATSTPSSPCSRSLACRRPGSWWTGKRSTGGGCSSSPP